MMEGHKNKQFVFLSFIFNKRHKKTYGTFLHAHRKQPKQITTGFPIQQIHTEGLPHMNWVLGEYTDSKGLIRLCIYAVWSHLLLLTESLGNVEYINVQKKLLSLTMRWVNSDDKLMLFFLFFFF